LTFCSGRELLDHFLGAFHRGAEVSEGPNQHAVTVREANDDAEGAPLLRHRRKELLELRRGCRRRLDDRGQLEHRQRRLDRLGGRSGLRVRPGVWAGATEGCGAIIGSSTGAAAAGSGRGSGAAGAIVGRSTGSGSSAVAGAGAARGIVFSSMVGAGSSTGAGAAAGGSGAAGASAAK
jgi:hypothetical protein